MIEFVAIKNCYIFIETISVGDPPPLQLVFSMNQSQESIPVVLTTPEYNQFQRIQELYRQLHPEHEKLKKEFNQLRRIQDLYQQILPEYEKLKKQMESLQGKPLSLKNSVVEFEQIPLSDVELRQSKSEGPHTLVLKENQQLRREIEEYKLEVRKHVNLKEKYQARLKQQDREAREREEALREEIEVVKGEVAQLLKIKDAKNSRIQELDEQIRILQDSQDPMMKSQMQLKLQQQATSNINTNNILRQYEEKMQKMQFEYQSKNMKYRQKIKPLENQVKELKGQVDELMKENERIRGKLEEMKNGGDLENLKKSGNSNKGSKQIGKEFEGAPVNRSSDTDQMR